MITMPAKIHRVSLSSMSFRSRDTITIDVVRLSSTAEKKNVNRLRIHINFTLLEVLMRSVMTLNPSCASTNSTMVMAPNRKKRMELMSSMWCNNRCSKK